MEGMKIRIINNLKGRVHAVNDLVALGGINDTQAGMKALRELTQDGTVEVERFNVPVPGKQPFKASLYILSYNARMEASEGLRRIK